MAKCRPAAGTIASLSENITTLKSLDGQKLTLYTDPPMELF